MQVVVFLHTLSTHHTTGLCSAIDLPDTRAGIQIDFSVLIPGQRTTTGTIDGSCGHAVGGVFLSDRG